LISILRDSIHLGRIILEKYKVIVVSTRLPTAKKLEECLNEYAEKGWLVKATLSGEYECIIILEKKEVSPSYREGF